MSKVEGPSAGINEIIDVFTQKILEDRMAEPSKYSPLRPSSSGKCERELGYEYMEFKGLAKYERTPNTPAVHRLLNLGHSVERHLIYELEAALRQAGIGAEIKYKQQALTLFTLHDGTIVEGNIDLVLQFKNSKVLVDIKSKGEKYSSWFKSNWHDFSEKILKYPSVSKIGENAFWIDDLPAFLDAFDDPFFAMNLIQANVYCNAEFMRERGITAGSILQYNKNTSELREVRFRPSEKVFNYVREKFQRVAETITRTQDPTQLSREYALGSSKCAFCPFNKQCWPKDDALKTHFRSLPPKRWPKDFDRLPGELQAKLGGLFKEFQDLTTGADRLEKVEHDILVLLDKAEVRKVRLESGEIYEIKELKSGGPGGGPRTVLRRGKL